MPHPMSASRRMRAATLVAVNPYRDAAERPARPLPIVVRAMKFWVPVGVTVMLVVIMALLAVGTTLRCHRAAPGEAATCQAFDPATFDSVHFQARSGALTK